MYEADSTLFVSQTVANPGVGLSVSIENFAVGFAAGKKTHNAEGNSVSNNKSEYVGLVVVRDIPGQALVLMTQIYKCVE